MQKKQQKYLSIVLVIVLLLSFSFLFIGCGKKDNNNSSTTPSTPSTPTMPNPPSEPSAPIVPEQPTVFQEIANYIHKNGTKVMDDLYQIDTSSYLQYDSANTIHEKRSIKYTMEYINLSSSIKKTVQNETFSLEIDCIIPPLTDYKNHAYSIKADFFAAPTETQSGSLLQCRVTLPATPFKNLYEKTDLPQFTLHNPGTNDVIEFYTKLAYVYIADGLNKLITDLNYLYSVIIKPDNQNAVTVYQHFYLPIFKNYFNYIP